jgi:hypothetical protein
MGRSKAEVEFVLAYCLGALKRRPYNDTATLVNLDGLSGVLAR